MDSSFVSELSDVPDIAFLQFEEAVRSERDLLLVPEPQGGDEFQKKLSVYRQYATRLESFQTIYSYGWSLTLKGPSSVVRTLGNSRLAWINWMNNLDEHIAKLRLNATLRLQRAGKLDLDEINKVKYPKYSQEIKTEIRLYVEKIRKILVSVEIDEGLRQSLLNKLNNFASEIDRTRTRFTVFLEFSLAITAVVREGAKNLEPVVKLIERIAAAIVRSDTRQKQLPPSDDIPQLPPPVAVIGQGEHSVDC
jgi:hypothetical protein